jgi:hypothetical protein
MYVKASGQRSEPTEHHESAISKPLGRTLYIEGVIAKRAVSTLVGNVIAVSRVLSSN